MKFTRRNSNAIFLLTRLTVHLKDQSQLVRIGRALVPLSSQRSEIGVEAIRHMTLLNFLQPLSSSSLERCIQLLSVNPKAEPIDFLRIYAMLYATEKSESSKEGIILKCKELFDFIIQGLTPLFMPIGFFKSKLIKL